MTDSSSSSYGRTNRHRPIVKTMDVSNDSSTVSLPLVPCSSDSSSSSAMTVSLNCDSSSSCGNSNSTIDLSLHEVYNDCNSSYSDDCRDRCHQKPCRYIPECGGFRSMITPLSSLTTLHGCPGSVRFLMRRKNKVITLQWEPFSGVISELGASYLTLTQTFSNMPPYPMNFPLLIVYQGMRRNTFLTIDSNIPTAQVKFYLNLDGTGTNVHVGDVVDVNGACISWIVE